MLQKAGEGSLRLLCPNREISRTRRPFLSLSKNFFDKLLQVFLNFPSSEKLMIENEWPRPPSLAAARQFTLRHPSWVSFVTIFLPAFRQFTFFRQAQAPRNFRSGALLYNSLLQAAAPFIRALALRTVRRRKMALRVTEAISAMGKDHHTSSSRPVRDRSHAAGSSTTS